jgi:hypothetical protein
MHVITPALALIFLSAFVMPSWATNTPCSGAKGGMSHCSGTFFVCNNGTTSQSKKNCQAVFRGGGRGDVVDDGDKSEKK